MCLTGRIEPEAEYLCKILHFCMEVDAVDSDKAGSTAESEKVKETQG